MLRSENNVKKKREPCNKATSQELLSRGGDEEIPLGIRRTARRFLYGNFIMLPSREEFPCAENEREVRKMRPER